MPPKINLRLLSQAGAFKLENKFNDCVLISGTDQIPCHRIILSKYSGWFKKYFSEHPIQKYGEMCRVSLPVNPDNFFHVFLDLLYTNTVHVTITNLPPLLKIAVYYEFTEFAAMLKNSYLEASNDLTILFLVEKFTELGLIEDAKSLAPQLAKHVVKIYQNDKTEPFKMEDIFKSLCPAVFAEVFHQDCISALISDEEKVAFIDEFVQFKNIEVTDKNDQEALASSIKWDAGSYQYMVRHKCDWLPARIARPILIRILDYRRRIHERLNANIERAEGQTSFSKWYLFSWAQAMADASGAKGVPRVNVVKFIRTLGGTANPFDPAKYGLIYVRSTEPLVKKFCAKNALLESPYMYFMANAEERNTKMPYLSFSLGPNSRFVIEEIAIDSSVVDRPFKNKTTINQKAPKGRVRRVKFSKGNHFNECLADTTSFPIVFTEDGKAKSSILTKIQPCSIMSITLDDSLTNGAYLMRIASIDVLGYFSNK